LILNASQQDELVAISRSRSLPAGYVFRAKLILMLAEGASFRTIKHKLGTTAPTPPPTGDISTLYAPAWTIFSAATRWARVTSQATASTTAGTSEPATPRTTTTLASYPPPPPGSIAGGPNSKTYPGFPSDPRLVGLPDQLHYLDESTSETTNDICIRWNAPLVWITAYLSDTAAC
jgi:hypothetical protein